MFLTLQQDLRFAIRQFNRSPGFVVTAVLTLALGVGTTTAIFSLLNGVLLRRLPFPNSDQLMAIDTLQFPEGAPATDTAAAWPVRTSYPNFFDWRDRNHTFEDLASCSYVPRLFSKMNGEGGRVMPSARISANLFETLGVAPVLGRGFTPEEDRPGHLVVMLSHELWTTDFGSSPNVLGQSVLVSDQPSTIVGVMPQGFHFPVDTPAYFWATSSADTEGRTPLNLERGSERLIVVGRLKPGVPREQALADLNAVQASLAHTYHEIRDKRAVSVTPLLEESVSDVRSGVDVLFVAVIFLLLIGCTNVAGLLLVRMNGRQAELALRSVLGASRPRLLIQLLLESLLLALLGGAFGTLFAFGLLRVGLRLIRNDFPRLYNVSLDGRVLAFALLLSAVTAFVIGLLPARRISQLDPVHALREGSLSTTASARRNRVQHVLVTAEIALSFTLLIGAGLLIKTVQNVLKIEPGFALQHTISFDIALTQTRYPDPSKILYFEKLLPKLAAIPGVVRVSGVHPLPLRWSTSKTIAIPGHPTSADNPPDAWNAVAMPGYFETLSIPLLHGRTFTEHDNDPKSPPVAVINQSFARKFFPGEDPIGRYFTPDASKPGEARVARQIVGIVGDTRMADLWNPYQPEYFLPYSQDPTHQRPVIVMRVTGDPSSYEEVARKLVADSDPVAPLFGYNTLAAAFGKQAIQPRFEAWMLSVFAAIAATLSAIGLYAVLSYIVAQRNRELGLRMALGASRRDLMQLVLRRGLGLAAIGIAGGCLASFYGSRLLAALLFKVAPWDPTVFSIVTLGLLLASLVSALVPAIRAARIEPMRSLRAE